MILLVRIIIQMTDKLVDGRYVKKETYSVGINDILIQSILI